MRSAMYLGRRAASIGKPAYRHIQKPSSTTTTFFHTHSVLPARDHARSRVHLPLQPSNHANRFSTSGAATAPIVLPSYNTKPELKTIRTNAGLVLALAIQRLYKDALCAGVVCTENGFYADFYLGDQTFSSAQLSSISTEMKSIVKSKKDIKFEQAQQEDRTVGTIMGSESSAKSAVIIGGEERIVFDGNIFEGITSSSGIGTLHTGLLGKGSWELESVSATHWRGDQSNNKKMLQRIYGTAWFDSKELVAYKEQQEQARARDHRTIGQKFDLFSIQEDAGGGLVFWHPKGSAVRRIIEDYWKQEHIKDGYEMLFTPHIANLDLWKTSGHCDFYKQDMFKPIQVDTDEYQLKPMNCPFHCLIYKNSPRNRRDLPLRWAELGTVYRYERSGALHGLFRVRGFTQDDAHIFCEPSQLEDEIVKVLDLIERILTRFGFKSYEVMLSTRPEESVGGDAIWTAATTALVNALNRKGAGWGTGYYTEDAGGGAFYGPKIDVKVRDSLGRLWQCSTVQCDFNLPERFQLEYTAGDEGLKRPIMVHRAIFGSIERFFGMLIENTAGAFPFWLAPVQVRVIPVSTENANVRTKCDSLLQTFKSAGFRAEIDYSEERITKSIRNSEVDKIPIVLVVGEEEAKTSNLSVRIRKHGPLRSGPVPEEALLSVLRKAVEDGVDDDKIVEALKERSVCIPSKDAKQQ